MLCRKSKPQLMPGLPFRAAGMMSFPLICHAPPNFFFFFKRSNRWFISDMDRLGSSEPSDPPHDAVIMPEDIITEAKISVIVPFW